MDDNALYQMMYERCKQAAYSRTTITYTDLAQDTPFVMKSPQDRNRLSAILGEISHHEHESGRPLLTAVVVQKTESVPSSGFFELARRIGKLEQGADEVVFWRAELDRVYDCWSEKQKQPHEPDDFATMTVTLSKNRFLELQNLATELGVAPEDLARAVIHELVSRPDDQFVQFLDEIYDKNAELYRRLA